MVEYKVNEIVKEGERNINRGKCYECQDRLEKGEGYRVYIMGRGIRMVCRKHYSNNGLLSYHGGDRTNTPSIGTEKITPLAKQLVGVEVETVKGVSEANLSEYTTLRQLLQKSFATEAEEDCTVSAEFPSEKMQGLAKISKVLQSMEKHDLIKYVADNSCGAHIHTSINDIEYIRRYYHSLFLPLYNYISAMSRQERLEVFGSDFRGYAMRINEDTNPRTHENFVNCQHRDTIEFRLPRIIGYKQYLTCVKFWREVGLLLNTFDFDKNNTDNTVRLRNAKKCGGEIVALAIKYFE